MTIGSATGIDFRGLPRFRFTGSPETTTVEFKVSLGLHLAADARTRWLLVLGSTVLVFLLALIIIDSFDELFKWRFMLKLWFNSLRLVVDEAGVRQ